MGAGGGGRRVGADAALATLACVLRGVLDSFVLH